MIVFLNILLIVVSLVYSGYELFKILAKTERRLYQLFFILLGLGHFITAFIVTYYLDTLTGLHDPHAFYDRALETSSWFDTFGLGHRFMSFLVYPFAHAHIHIEVLFVVCTAISFKGFLLYMELLQVPKFKQTSSLFLLSFFLIPSIHYWTSMLSKEALLVFLLVLVLQKVHQKKYNYQLGLLLIPIFLIRPHLCLVLLAAFLIYFLWNPSISYRLKKSILYSFILAVVILIPLFFIFFLKLEQLNFSTISTYYYEFIAYTVNRGNTAISLADTNLFSRIGYLMFMPLPYLYPIKNTFITIISIENLFYILTVVYVIWQRKTIDWRKLYSSQSIKFTAIFSALCIVLFASYLYNLGLGNRMRIMFYPYVFFMLISLLQQDKN
jgi:hypothetical protein